MGKILPAPFPVNAFLIRNPKIGLNEHIRIIEERIFKPRADCEEFIIKCPLDWEANDRFEDRNWRMKLQAFSMFESIIHIFDDLEDKSTAVNYFLDVLRDWYNVYGDDPDDIITSRMPESYSWYDMSTGLRSLILAFFINRISVFDIKVSTIDEELILNAYNKHRRHLLNPKVFSLNNHGIFQIQGLMALLQNYNVTTNQIALDYAKNKMTELVKSQFDINGVHTEHSPHYHIFAVNLFESIIENGWYSGSEIPNFVGRAIEVSKWLIDPNKCPACIGDSILTVQNRVNFSRNFYQNLLENKVEEVESVFSNFNNSGYSIFRSEWNVKAEESAYLFFMGMYNSKIHKHRDCLSFEWFENGQKIICDSGKYGYKSDKLRSFFLSNRAHNNIEIEGFDILKENPYKSAIDETSFKKGVFQIKSSINYPKSIIERNLFYKKGHWIIIEDKVTLQKTKKINQWFHINKDYDLVSHNKNCFKFSSKKSNLIINSLNVGIKPSIYRGDDDLMQGFLSEKDLEYDKNFTVGYSCKGNNLYSITILALGESEYKNALSYTKSLKCPNLKEKKQKKSVNLIPNIKHFEINKPTFNLKLGKATYDISAEKGNLCFYLDYKSNEKEFIVLLPGAINRDKIIKNFQRFSWSDEMDYNVISVLDPTIKEDNSISIGWFVGNERQFALDSLIVYFRKLFQNNKVPTNKVTFFGTSAGGYTALKISSYFLDSKIIVINPQTDVFKYYEKDYKILLEKCFPSYSEEEVKAKFSNRFTVNVNLYRRIAPIFYFQNKYDRHHTKEHLKPFLSTIKSNYQNLINVEQDFELNDISKLNVLMYSDDESKHTPPSKEITLNWINKLSKF